MKIKVQRTFKSLKTRRDWLKLIDSPPNVTAVRIKFKGKTR